MTTPSVNHVSADNAEDIIRLAGSGSIPAVGLGTWKIPTTQASEVVWEAMRVGYRHLDCACDYGNEPEVGAGLSRAFADGLCRREQAWITSKLWNTYHDPRHVRLACERSLRDLLAYARMRPSVLQVELHPFLTQEKLLRYCRREGIAVTAFSPLGALSYFSLGMAQPDESVLDLAEVREAAVRHDQTPAQVVLRWGVQRGTAVIPKTSTGKRLKQNLALFDFRLNEDEMKAISALNRNRRFNDPGDFCEKAFNTFFPIYE